jgi:hypothetical protein
VLPESPQPGEPLIAPEGYRIGAPSSIDAAKDLTYRERDRRERSSELGDEMEAEAKADEESEAELNEEDGSD